MEKNVRPKSKSKSKSKSKNNTNTSNKYIKYNKLINYKGTLFDDLDLGILEILYKLGYKCQKGKEKELSKWMNEISEEFKDISFKEEGIYPVFYCDQEIPCNPCTSVCPQEQIETIEDLITQLPYFKGEQDCIGCGKCVAVCPGLAVLLVDYRKDKHNPLVTFPLELTNKKLEIEEKVVVVSNERELGEFEVYRSKVLKEFPKTQLITVQLPSEIAKQAVAIKLYRSIYRDTMELYQKSFTDDDIIVCRCERVSVGEIRKWIRSGVRDFNELKALTKAGMGACGGKTCTLLIERIFQEEGISINEIIPGTKRPLFIEVPMGIFVNARDKEERL